MCPFHTFLSVASFCLISRLVCFFLAHFRPLCFFRSGSSELSLPAPPLESLAMADAYVWVSAYFPHPFRPNEVVQAFWKEERQGSTGAWRAGVSPPLGCVPDCASGEVKPDAAVSSAIAPARSHTKCVGLDWDSSSGDDGMYQVSKSNSQCQSTPWVPSSPPPPLPPDRSAPLTAPVSLPPGFQSPPVCHEVEIVT